MEPEDDISFMSLLFVTTKIWNPAAAASHLESNSRFSSSQIPPSVRYSRSVQAADDVEGCVGVLVNLQQRARSKKHTDTLDFVFDTDSALTRLSLTNTSIIYFSS